MQRKQKIVDQLVGGLGSMLKGRKVTVLDGHGTPRLRPHRHRQRRSSGEVEMTADAVILAPGSVPRTIPASTSTAPWS